MHRCSPKASSLICRSVPSLCMARFPARQVVARGWARKSLLQIAYAIGVGGPLSFLVETSGTGKRSAGDIGSALRDEFELTPAGILITLDLQRQIYELTTTDGHFGRVREGFTSEQASG